MATERTKMKRVDLNFNPNYRFEVICKKFEKTEKQK